MLIYFGIEPKPFFSICNLLPCYELARRVKQGDSVKILIADIHSNLRDYYKKEKSSAELTTDCIFNVRRTMSMFECPENTYEIIMGKELQMNEVYFTRLLELMKHSTSHDAKKAACNTERHPKMNELMYPLMQIMDEIILDADVQVASEDHAATFELARRCKEKMNITKQCSAVMTPVIPSFKKEISNMDRAVLAANRIDMDTDAAHIKWRLDRYMLQPGETDDKNNTVLSLIKNVVFGTAHRLTSYDKYEDFVADWLSNNITVQQVKDELMIAIDNLIYKFSNA